MNEGPIDSAEKRSWPEFSSVASEHQVRLTRESSFRAWVGNVERLSILERQIETALREAYEAYVGSLELDEEDAWEAEVAVEWLRMRTSVTANGGRMTRTGAIAAVLADMDTREVEKITMGNQTNDPDMPVISLRMQANLDNSYRTVKLAVTGSDRQWVAGVHDVLATEIRRGVPKWGFMRSPILGFFLGVAILVGVSGIAMFVGWVEPKDLLWIGIFGIWIGGFLLAFPLTGLLCKVFPGLEVVEAGGTPRDGKPLDGQARAFLCYSGQRASSLASWLSERRRSRRS